MNFFDQAGKKAIGSRLRRLSERITEDAAQVYALYGADFHPKWFPVFYVLSEGQEKAITAIAEEIGHSHPSVSKIVREMTTKGLISEMPDATDRRRNVVKLSETGLETAMKMKDQLTDVNEVIEEILGQTTHDLWKAMGEWEFLLDHQSLYERVREQRKKRESAQVQIVDYSPVYQSAFRDLNEEWISKYFVMEPEDYKALDHPKEEILDKGGYILVALYEGEPVGVCALKKMSIPDFEYELAKMAVSPKAQGRSIGWILGKAVLEKARALGARSVFLESNTTLKPAISLYHKLGFQKVSGYESPYERSNIQMAVTL